MMSKLRRPIRKAVTFHIPVVVTQRKSLVPETAPGQAADLRTMRRGHRTRFAHAVSAQGSRLLGVLLAGVSTACFGPSPTAYADAGPPSVDAAPASPTDSGAPSSSTNHDKDAPRYVRARVVHSLEETFVQATDRELGPALAQVVKRIIVWWLNPRRDLFGGDVIEVVYEEPPGAEPMVIAVWMRSQKLRRTFSAVRYRKEGARFDRYYSPDGREIERRLRRSPVRDYEQITSLLGDGRGHKGIDFKAPVGTPVYAPFSGKVLRRNWSTRANGRCLELRDRRTGRHAIMLHLHSIPRRIRPGTRIKVGQRIATLGNTGRSSAPHLHYQLQRANGRVLNPLRVHRTWRARLSASETKKVKQKFLRLAKMRTGST